jgi:hypothetical protein
MLAVLAGIGFILLINNKQIKTVFAFQKIPNLFKQVACI